MTRDKIQQLARDAGGIRAVEYADPECFMGNMTFTDQELAAFAALVLEEAARVCDEKAKRDFPWGSESSDIYHTQADWAAVCAKAIRTMKPE